MKNYTALLTLFGIVTILTSCNNNDDFQSQFNQEVNACFSNNNQIASLNYIPDWVEDCISDEQYSILQVLCNRYEIDYTFLSADISLKRKQDIFRILKRLSEKVMQDESSDNLGGVLSFYIEPHAIQSIERLSPTEDEYIEARTHSGVAYTAYRNPYAQVLFHVVYKYNSQTGECYDVSATTSAYGSVGNQKVQFSGVINMAYNPSTKTIGGSCSGRISWLTMVSQGTEVFAHEDFSQNLSVVP